jgi:hypothetical protein
MGYVLVRMKREKLKLSEDYALMSSRISSEAKKNRLEKAIKSMQAWYNSKKHLDEKKIKQYQVFEEALELGIAALKKRDQS